MSNRNNESKKVFDFPEDVESNYKVIKGVSSRNFFTIILPFILLGGGIIALPPYSIPLLFARGFVGIVIGMIGFAIVLIKPIQDRPNISLIQWVKFGQHYKKRQKLFFLKTKGLEGVNNGKKNN